MVARVVRYVLLASSAGAHARHPAFATKCTVVVFLSSCQREAAQCGAGRSGAERSDGTRPKGFVEQPELEALSVHDDSALMVARVVRYMVLLASSVHDDSTLMVVRVVRYI